MLQLIIPLKIEKDVILADSVVVKIDNTSLHMALVFRWNPPSQYRPQIHCQIAETHTLYLAKYVYEQLYGKSDKPVRFLDGDSLNCQIANLTTDSNVGFTPSWKRFDRPTREQLELNRDYQIRAYELSKLPSWESEMWLRKSSEFNDFQEDDNTEIYG